MDIALACNWDPALIDVARRFGVAELFGKLDHDVVGGGRARLISRPIARRDAAAYIRRVQDAGIAFNYLLNASTMGNLEFSRRGHREVEALLDWLTDCGVRRFTVAIPYLAGKIRRRVPDAELAVSMMARVETVEQAKSWEDLGASILILPNNKDFAFIRVLKRHTGLRLEVTANLSCLDSCFQMSYHANVVSHASNRSGDGLYTLPVCEVRCNLMKVAEPRRILAGQWIRPEDLHHYEALGVDRLKVLDRTSATPDIEAILDAYGRRSYGGNLAELIPGYRQSRVREYFPWKQALRTALGLLRPDKYNPLRLPGFHQRNRPPGLTIDSGSMDGFLEGVMARDCRNLSCADCGWCDRWAGQVVHFDPADRKRFLEDSEKNLEDLEGGSFFR